MNCYIVDIKEYVALVEYSDKTGTHRKWVSRDIYQSPIKFVWTDISKKELDAATDYSDVMLMDNLGENYFGISVRDLEQAMRKAGLWTRADYQKKPDAVAKVLRLNHFKIDTTSVLNAAIYQGVNNDS